MKLGIGGYPFSASGHEIIIRLFRQTFLDRNPTIGLCDRYSFLFVHAYPSIGNYRSRRNFRLGKAGFA